MVLLLSPHQQQEWHVDEAELDYTFLIFREDFMRTFIADKFFVYRLLYYCTCLPRRKNWRNICASWGR